MEILPLNRERVQDANPTNEPFAMIGRLVPTYAEGKWRWTEELLAVPREKVYEDEARDWTEYIDKPDKAIFLCYLNGQCAGRIVLHEAWNRYAFIEDLDVKRAFRRQGVGTALMACVVPYIIPDLLKILLAATIAPRLRRALNR